MSNLKKVRPIDQHYFDLFITACEGGVNYWGQPTGYHWTVDGVDDHDGFRTVLVDVESSDRWVLDRSVIARGWKLATTSWRKKISWSTGEPPVVWTEHSDWDFDAEDADAIVQLGLFEDIVFG
jgi:hypothetical protein